MKELTERRKDAWLSTGLKPSSRLNKSQSKSTMPQSRFERHYFSHSVNVPPVRSQRDQRKTGTAVNREVIYQAFNLENERVLASSREPSKSELEFYQSTEEPQSGNVSVVIQQPPRNVNQASS